MLHPPLPPRQLSNRPALRRLSLVPPGERWLYSVLLLRYSTSKLHVPDSIVPEGCIQLPLEISIIKECTCHC